MKRTLLFLAILVLIPASSMAYATLGIYFSGVQHYEPSPFVPFDMELYLVHTDYFVTAVEYQFLTPDDPTFGRFIIFSISFPDNQSVELGDPTSGHSITYWPPCSGYPEGYDLLATFSCMTLLDCSYIPDFRLVIGPHPDSGELRGTYTPDNETFPIIGLTSYLCPVTIGVESATWGSIKALSR